MDCIFNVDETGLFFQCFPKRTYILRDENGQKIRGSKKMTEKARVTLVPCCNSTGSFKIPMVMIGKSKNPHCFRRKRIPLRYLSQKRAWMDANLFQKWFDEVFAPSVRQWTTRKVVLILDNCPGHVLVNNYSYIEIVYLPPNVTSVYQPMDMGIIISLKRRYKKKLVLKLLEAIENWDQLVQLQPLQPYGCKGLDHGCKPKNISSECWAAVTSETIVNCYIKSNILPAEHIQELKAMSLKWKRRTQKSNAPSDAEVESKPAAAAVSDNEDEDEDDELTVAALMNKLASARLPASVISTNSTSQLPGLFDDNLCVQEHNAQELQESLERWFNVEDEAEVKLAELEAALEEIEKKELEESASETEPSEKSVSVVSSMTMAEAKQSLVEICKFSASIGCLDAQDHITSALHFLNKHTLHELHAKTSNARQLTLHDTLRHATK